MERRWCKKDLSRFPYDFYGMKKGHANLWVDSREYYIVENVHNTWLSALADKIAGGDS